MFSMRSFFAILSTCCFTLSVFFLPACGANYLYESKQDIPNDQWLYSDSMRFTFEVKDTSKRYNFYLDFDYDDQYTSQNIYLRLSTQYPNGKQLTKVRSFDLFDAGGTPMGKSSGSSHTLRTALQEHAFFNQIGQHTVTIAQFMRRDSLPGMRAIGLAVEQLGDQ
jgi:gliding motility-associated lipoprotein GldH